MARLKAVFFVRDFNGNPAYRERKVFDGAGQGRRVEVTFADGEVIVGTTLNYRPDGQGFFLSPADPAANNTRIFVVAKRRPPGTIPVTRPRAGPESVPGPTKAHPISTRYPLWTLCQLRVEQGHVQYPARRLINVKVELTSRTRTALDKIEIDDPGSVVTRSPAGARYFRPRSGIKVALTPRHPQAQPERRACLRRC